MTKNKADKVQSSPDSLQVTEVQDPIGSSNRRQGNVSTDEGILSSREELRSTNKQLTTTSDYAVAIVQTICQPLVILTGDLRVKSANQSFYQTFRVTPAEIENQLLYELGGGQWDQPALRKLLAEILSTESFLNNYEFEFESQDVGRRVMLLDARRLLQEPNQTDLILLTVSDVTDWKAAEVDLQVSERRYRRLFESARDGILLLDPETGKIVDANPYMEELLGYAHFQLVGKELWEIGLLQDRLASQQAIRKLQERGYLRSEDLPLQTAGGEKRDVEFVSNLYQEGDHSVIQCNIRDITQRKQAEQALSESNRNKDVFLAVLGHELRNPLSGIVSGLEALKQIRSHDDANTTELYDVIVRQTKLVTRLVDDLLDVSRISAGKIRLRRKRFNLVELVATVISDHRRLIEEGKLSIASELPDSSIWIKGDRSRISQVFNNLLNNATKFTEAGGSIKVSVEAGGKTGQGTAKVIVQDTGIGMEPAIVATMFELYRQAETSFARSRGGLGLGMALSKQLVELHGGSISTNSKGLGHGSTFTVNLPLSSDQTFVPRPEIRLSTGVLKKHRIVIIDDQRGLRVPMKRLLSSLGQEVVAEPEDGITALAAIRELRPEIVFCDIGLPDMDGYTVARKIRLDAQLSATFLVAVTGYGQDNNRQVARNSGFDLHLTKPIGNDVLRGAIEKFDSRQSTPGIGERYRV